MSLLLLLQTESGSPPSHTVPTEIEDLTTLFVTRLATLRAAATEPPTLDSTTIMRAELNTVHADSDALGADLNTDFGRVRG